jgi:hypothetical protein
MELPPLITIEAHPRAATLYLSGTLTASGVLRAVALCDALPAPVRVVRLVGRAVEVGDTHAVKALTHALGARGGREGRDLFVANPCSGRDAAQASSPRAGAGGATARQAR